MNLADRILLYNESLSYTDALPEELDILNPVSDNATVRDICRDFYQHFYGDNNPRYLILGINPGRLGAGATGLPFTDTKRLVEKCGLTAPGFSTHEPSSVFMYDMMEAFGGVRAFYHAYYISSVFPLAIIKKKEKGNYVNYNYYDDAGLQKSLTPYIIDHLQKQVELCGKNDVVFCLGRGKNYAFLNALNEKHRFFGKVVPLEHPRFIMQYRAKTKNDYIDQYLEAFRSNM